MCAGTNPEKETEALLGRDRLLQEISEGLQVRKNREMNERERRGTHVEKGLRAAGDKQW